MGTTADIPAQIAEIINSGRLKKQIEYADNYLRKLNIADRAVTGEDITNEAIFKILVGDRKWDPEQEPDFYKFLHMAVRSCVLNVRKHEKDIIKELILLSEENAEQEFLLTKAEASSNLSCKAYEIRDFVERGVELLKDNDECALIFLCLYEGMARKEIAEYMNIDIRNVNAAFKLIKRQLQPLINDYKQDKTNIRRNGSHEKIN